MTDGGDRTHGLGRIRIWSTELRFGDPAAAPELDAPGYGAVWIPDGIGGPVLEAVAHLLDATPRIAIATASSSPAATIRPRSPAGGMAGPRRIMRG